MRKWWLIAALGTSGCDQGNDCSDTGGVCAPPLNFAIQDSDAQIATVSSTGACGGCHAGGICERIGSGHCEITVTTTDGRSGTGTAEIDVEETGGCCGPYDKSGERVRVLITVK